MREACFLPAAEVLPQLSPAGREGLKERPDRAALPRSAAGRGPGRPPSRNLEEEVWSS